MDRQLTTFDMGVVHVPQRAETVTPAFGRRGHRQSRQSAVAHQRKRREEQQL